MFFAPAAFKLAPFQGLLGLVAIGVAVGFLVIDLVFMSAATAAAAAG